MQLWLLATGLAAGLAEPDGQVCLLSLRSTSTRLTEGDVDHYRLGHVFFGPRRDEDGERYHRRHFPTSIATSYLAAARRMQDWTALLGVVRDRLGERSGPPPGALVVHVRAGDVLDRAAEPAADFLGRPQPVCLEDHLFEPAGNVYAQPLRYFRQLSIPSSVTHVVLVDSTTHRGAGAPPGDEKSRQYLRAVAAVFAARYDVTERRNGDPDQDFLFMAQAELFVPSGGLFSAAAAGVVARRGGVVIGEPVSRVSVGQVMLRCWEHSPGYVLRRLALPWAAVLLAVLLGLPRVALVLHPAVCTRSCKTSCKTAHLCPGLADTNEASVEKGVAAGSPARSTEAWDSAISEVGEVCSDEASDSGSSEVEFVAGEA